MLVMGLFMEPRLPPQNIDAEQSIIGGLMLEEEAWDEIADIIAAEHFYKSAHGKIFETIKKLKDKGQPVDIITVTNSLKERGEIDAIGGAGYLADIINRTPTAVNIASYAQIVVEKATLRRMIHTCSTVIEEAFSQSYESIGNFIDQVEAKVFAVAQNQSAKGLIGAGEIVKSSLEKIEELFINKAEITGVTSGFAELDRMTAGFQPGELIIIAARPSMGKTAFSLNIAQYAALRSRKSVAYFSVEMSKETLMMRILAGESKLDLGKLRVGQVSDSQWPKLINTAARVSEAPLFIDDTSGISPFEIRAKCRRLKAQHGLDMIMIDYLQIMDLKQKVESRERAVSEISKTLKAIAKELKVPVIALAQLNRGVEGRSDRRPMLSDLRESGSIEQDADVIMMLFREGYYDRENPEAQVEAEVIIGKQRNGPTGTVKLVWDAKTGSFGDFVPNSDAPAPQAPQGPMNQRGKLRNFAPNT
jgi:replicative DNA helicase